MARIVSRSTVRGRNVCWRKVEVEAFYVKYSLHSNLYSGDTKHNSLLALLFFKYILTAVKMSEAPSETPPAAVCGGWAQQGSPLLINRTASAPFN